MPNKDLPDHKRWNRDVFWLHRQKLILLFYVLGAWIAFATPEDIFSHSPYLKKYVDTISSTIPMIGNLAAGSVFPEMARLYGAVMCFSIPGFLWTWHRWPYLAQQKAYILERFHSGFVHVIRGILLILVGMVGTYIYLFGHTQLGDFHIAPFHTSRLALALLGPFFYGLVPSGMLMMMWHLLDLLRCYFKQVRIF